MGQDQSSWYPRWSMSSRGGIEPCCGWDAMTAVIVIHIEQNITWTENRRVGIGAH
jgi:hypothetical protein